MSAQRSNTKAVEQPPIFWTEGAIDVISLEKPIRLRLMPSSAFLFSEASKNRILFVASVTQGEGENETDKQKETKSFRTSNAKIVDCFKNTGGKECLWFSVDVDSMPQCLAELLLAAKNARCGVRVGVAESEFEKLPAKLTGKSPFVVSKLMFV